MHVVLLKMQTKNVLNILNEKVIEESCEMYFNTRFEALKKRDARCDSKEIK